jgi:hypothetical protein
MKLETSNDLSERTWPNALQRTRASHHGCNRGVSRAGRGRCVRQLATVKASTLTILLVVVLLSARLPIAAEPQPTIPNAQYSWPATLKNLPFGARASYRDTGFEIEVVLEKDSSFLLVFRHSKLLFRCDFGLVGQFRLLTQTHFIRSLRRGAIDMTTCKPDF